MRLNRPAALLAAVLLTVAAACSSPPKAELVEGTARPGTSAGTPGSAPGTTAGGGGAGGSTTTAPPAGRSTTTTAARASGPVANDFTPAPRPLVPAPTPGSFPRDTSAIQDVLRNSYGVRFTPEQGACLGEGFADDPELLRAFEDRYAPPLPQSQAAVAILVRCYGGVGPAAAAVLQSSVSQGSLTAAQASCMLGVLGGLPADELARLLALDSTAVAAHQGALSRCTGASGSA